MVGRTTWIEGVSATDTTGDDPFAMASWHHWIWHLLERSVEMGSLCDNISTTVGVCCGQDQATTPYYDGHIRHDMANTVETYGLVC